LGLGYFLRIQERVYRGVYAHSKPVGIFAQAGYVFYGITGSLPGPERRAGNINGIGPAVNGCEADIYRSGWSQ
jgi:hypothetical protein